MEIISPEESIKMLGTIAISPDHIIAYYPAKAALAILQIIDPAKNWTLQEIINLKKEYVDYNPSTDC